MSGTDWTPARLREVQQLFEAALEAAPGDLEGWLQAAAPHDAALREEVRSLLEVHLREDATLGRAPLADLAVDRAGTVVGHWRVGREIGRGGMGSVHEATREDREFEQRVAIKFLRPGAEGELAIRRFRYERQILANLNHPNIAALLDGGVTPDGQPYLVMELVEGEPLTTWCDARHRTVRDRLRLFLQVCTAVQHAHQNLVVHRDLKPGNILVTPDGTAKLLDFGIARLLREAEGLDQLPPTQQGARLFTPEYAAPEQVRGLPVGTATDIHALGVILFELLVGRRPFDLRGKLLAEIERIIATEPPPRPSSVLPEDRWRALGARSVRAARQRIRGDLDAIVLTALRKEPERRYASADQLGRDLRAHLDGLPVTARPDSVGYRVGKFLKRRAVETVAATLVLATLVGGIVATTRQARAAEAERARVTEIRDFLVNMLGSADPGALGRDVTVREVLDSAAVRADASDGSPDLRADIQEVLGETYLALGEYDVARDRLAHAVDLRREPGGGTPRQLALALGKEANAWVGVGEYPLADSVLTIADSLAREHTDPDDPIRGDILSSRAAMRQELGDLASAEVLHRAALAFRLRVTPDNDAALANEYNDVAVVIGQQGRFVEADSFHQLAIAAGRRAWDENQPDLATVIGQRAYPLEMLGRLDEADSTYRLAIAMRRRILGPEHPDYAWSVFQYAQFLVRAGRWREALDRAREVLALRGRTLPETHPAVSTALQAAGLALDHLDSLEAGGRYLRESLALRRTTFGADHWLTASGESVLGEHLTRTGNYGEAERLLLGAEQRLVEVRGDDSPQAVDARRRLVALYQAWKRPAEAARWEARLPADSTSP